MLTVEEHLALATRNEDFSVNIVALPNRYPEWEITSLFYSSLHFVSAYLAEQGHDPETHYARNHLVAALTNVGTDYQNLYRLSLNARYRRSSFSTSRADEIRAGPFRRVKEGVQALLRNHPRG